MDIGIQEEFYDIKHDIDATRRFEKGDYHSLWNDADILIKYPSLWQRVKLLMIAFSKVNSLLQIKETSHLVVIYD